MTFINDPKGWGRLQDGRSNPLILFESLGPRNIKHSSLSIAICCWAAENSVVSATSPATPSRLTRTATLVPISWRFYTGSPSFPSLSSLPSLRAYPLY